MSVVLILFAGLIVVVGGILFLRMHAFVALILAALLVAALTSPVQTIRSQLTAKSVRITLTDVRNLTVESSTVLSADTDWVILPELYDSRSPDSQTAVRFEEQSDAPSTSIGETTKNSGAGPQAGESGSRHLYRIRATNGQQVQGLSDAAPDLHVVPASTYQSALKAAKSSAITRVSEAFGTSCGKLAILIVAASIIGQCLLQSGAADRVVQSALQFFGEKSAPAAFTISGFILGIPVFFDTVFLLMVPLGKSLFNRTRRNYLLYIMSMIIGATMAHSLVPPTPGPLLIAEEFRVPMSRMILGGCIVGLIGAGAGLLFAYRMNAHNQLFPTDVDSSVNRSETDSSSVQTPQGPSLGEALLPVLLPVALMTLESCFDQQSGHLQLGPLTVTGTAASLLRSLCEKNIALLIGAALSVVTFIRFRHPTREGIAAAMQTAVSSAGTIILVTAAGGAFGEVMKQTSVAELLQQIPAASPLAIVVAAFVVTAAVRAAQGSATVAMMTAAGVFGGLVTSGAAGVDPLYVALAVGCGSKPLPWMNDSGFLVITRMSGMTEAQGLKFITPLLTIAGLVGLATVVIGVIFFP